MKTRPQIDKRVFFVAPFVAALVALALWLALAAALENWRLGRGVDQILSIVARARDMRISPRADPSQAVADLLDRLDRFDGMGLRSLVDLHGVAAGRGVAMPWDNVARLFLYPSAQALRIEAPWSHNACRKMLQFYARDAASLGLLRVDIRDDMPSATWRLVYEQARGSESGGLDAGAIGAGCGQAPRAIVSLTFGLKG